MDTLKNLYRPAWASRSWAARWYRDNEAALLEEVRSVSSLVGDMLEKYITVEISAATQTSRPAAAAIVRWFCG